MDTSDLKSGADKAGGIIDKFKGGVGEAGGFLGQAFSFATGGLIAKGVETITGSIGGFFSDSIGESQSWNAAMAQTEAVVKSTGGAAGLSAQAMGDLASSLSGGAGMSLAADDAVLAGENLLATFTNIGKDTFPQATATMVDMAQAMGTDVSSQAVALGKALNDPIKGVSALGRVGVTFTDQQKEQIATMVKAGDVAGAQGVIMGELGKEFGGSAAAAAKADGGMFQLSEQIANLKQGVGDALLPILHSLAGFANDTLVPAIGKVFDTVGQFAGLLGSAFSGGLKLDQIQALPGFLQPLGLLFGTIAENVGEFVTAIQGGTSPLQALGDLIKNNFVDLAPQIGSLLGGLGQMLMTAIGAGLDFVAQNALPAIGGLLQNLGSSIASSIDSLLAPQVTSGMAGVGNSFFDFIGTTVLPKVGEIFGTVASAIGTWITGDGLTSLIANLARWGQALVDWIGPMIGPALGQLAAWGQAAFDWLINTGLPTAVSKLGEWAGAFLGWIGPLIGPFLGQLADWAGQALGWLIGTGLPLLLGKLGEWAGGFLGWIGPMIPPFLKQLADWGYAAGEWLLNTGLPLLVTKLTEWGNALINWVSKDALPFIGQKLADFGTAVWNWITTDALPNLIAKMILMGNALTNWVSKDALPFIGGKLADFANAIWSWITQAASDAVVKAAVIGSQMIAGITNALAQGKQAVINFITGIAQGSLDAIKTFFGISSPSTVMFDLGTNLVAGLSNALIAGDTPLTTAMTGALAPVSALLQAQATKPTDPGSMLYWWGGNPNAIIPTMERMIDNNGAASLKAYVGPAFKGVTDKVFLTLQTETPAITDMWKNWLSELKTTVDSYVGQINESFSHIQYPTPPGGGPPGSPPPAGTPPGGGGLPPGLKKDFALFGGAATAALPPINVAVYVSNGAGGWQKAPPGAVMVEVDFAQRQMFGEGAAA